MKGNDVLQCVHCIARSIASFQTISYFQGEEVCQAQATAVKPVKLPLRSLSQSSFGRMKNMLSRVAGESVMGLNVWHEYEQ